MKNKYKLMGIAISAALLTLTACCKDCKAAPKSPKPLSLNRAMKLYPQTIYAKDYGAIPNDGKDDAKALREAIEAAKVMSENGGVRIELEEGKYDLASSETAYMPIANAKKNHDRRQGRNMIQHKPATIFKIENSEDITVANLNFEALEIPFAGAKVTALGEDYFDCQVVAPHKVREVSPKAVINYNPELGAMDWTGTDVYQLATKLKIKKLSEDTMRVPLEQFAKKTPAKGGLFRYRAL